jgi:hypothetical protein
MFKRSIPVAVALLTFAVGVGVASLRMTLNRPRPPSVSAPQVQLVSSNVEIKRTYRSLMHASGRAGKHRACFGGFRSSDGMTFSTTDIYFDSSNHARREMQRRLKKAIEIVSRQPLLDASGQVVGEEVVATFPPYDKGSMLSAELIVMDGTHFNSIGSSSLRNVTEYKRDRRP